MTLTQLAWKFEAWLREEIRAGRLAPTTLVYYQTLLAPFIRHVGPAADVAGLDRSKLEGYPRTWHRLQAVQRLFNWAVDSDLLAASPFARIRKPPAGQRERVLSPAELVRLLRASGAALRRVLLGQRFTIARPQEVRAVLWQQYQVELGGFVLTEWKSKRRRKDGLRRRLLPVAPRLARLLERLRRRAPATTDHVFLNCLGQPWTSNALRLAVGHAVERAGLSLAGAEAVVAYTLRHTAATQATANGVRDRLLADIMGHTSTRTTARYQHLDSEALVAGILQATAKRR